MLLIQRLKQGSVRVTETDEYGLVTKLEHVPPTSLELQAARALIRDQQIIEGLMNMLQQAATDLHNSEQRFADLVNGANRAN